MLETSYSLCTMTIYTFLWWTERLTLLSDDSQRLFARLYTRKGLSYHAYFFIYAIWNFSCFDRILWRDMIHMIPHNCIKTWLLLLYWNLSQVLLCMIKSQNNNSFFNFFRTWKRMSNDDIPHVILIELGSLLPFLWSPFLSKSLILSLLCVFSPLPFPTLSPPSSLFQVDLWGIGVPVRLDLWCVSCVFFPYSLDPNVFGMPVVLT